MAVWLTPQTLQKSVPPLVLDVGSKFWEMFSRRFRVYPVICERVLRFNSLYGSVYNFNA